MARTEAERLDWLVQQGADRFVETFLTTMKFMSQGGRTPGLTVPSKDELRAFYVNTDPGYWQTIAAVDPKEAQSQVEQFAQVEGGA